MDQIQQLIAHWTAHGISCPPGVSPSEISAFESRHGVVLPVDLRSYFLAVDGMGELGECVPIDHDHFRFWALADVVTIAEELPDRCSRFAEASHYFIIADCSESLPEYAIRLSADAEAANPVASIYADFGALVVEDFFESFTDFVKHYLDDPFETGATIPANTPDPFILLNPSRPDPSTWYGRAARFARRLLSRNSPDATQEPPRLR